MYNKETMGYRFVELLCAALVLLGGGAGCASTGAVPPTAGPAGATAPVLGAVVKATASTGPGVTSTTETATTGAAETVTGQGTETAAAGATGTATAAVTEAGTVGATATAAVCPSLGASETATVGATAGATETAGTAETATAGPPTTTLPCPTQGATEAATTAPAVSAPTAEPHPVEVRIVEPPGQGTPSWGFTPATVRVKAGTPVVWTNTGNSPHTVTADDGKRFDSGILDPKATFRFTPRQAGTIAYHCKLHTWMKGTLVVQP